jgi:hypothetical protein
LVKWMVKSINGRSQLHNHITAHAQSSLLLGVLL